MSKEPHGGPDPALLRLDAPARQLGDTPLAVHVSGARSNARLVLRLTSRSPGDGGGAAEASFTSPDGTLDLGRDAPDEGYAGVDPDGLLREAWRTGLPAAVRGSLAPVLLELEVTVDDTHRRVARIQREVLADGVERRTVEVAGVPATLFIPDRHAARYPAVVVLASPTCQSPARAAAIVASRGYPALAAEEDRSLAAASPSFIDAARRLLCHGDHAREALDRLAIVPLTGDPEQRDPAVVRAWDAAMTHLRRRTVELLRSGATDVFGRDLR